MNNLFESILWEASKRRFIDKVYYDVTANPRRCELFLSHTKSASKHMPGREALIKWVDSGAADKYKIDWNTILKSTPDDPGEFGRLVDAYYDYEDNNEKVKRTNPILVFKNSGLNYNTESNPDFLYLGESDKFLFIGVCTYNAAVFCDSFKCGGAGAQWCIGTKDENGYWYDYYYKGNAFVIAYNKTTFGDTEKQKYMLQLYKESDETRATVWNQPDDDIIRCVGIEGWENFSNIFSIGKEDCERFFNKVFEIAGYKGEDILNVKRIIVYDYRYKARPQRVIQLSDLDIPNFNYSILARNIDGLDQARVLEYNASEKKDLYYDNIILGPKTLGEYNALNRIDQYPAITFKDCGNIYIKDLWSSIYPIGLSFVDCDKIAIDTIHLPAYNSLLDWVSKNGVDGITTILKNDLDLSLPNCEIKNIIFSPSADFCNNHPDYVFITRPDPDYDLPLLISLSEIQNGIQMDVSEIKQPITIDFRNQLSLFKSDKFDISDVIENVTHNTPAIRAINVPESKQVYWSDQSLYPDISFNIFTVPEHK